MTKKTIKVICNLSNYTQGLQKDYYLKKIEQYGSEENLKKYYIQNKIIVLLKKGYTLEDISKLVGFKLDESKSEYYKELVKFHLNLKNDLIVTQSDKIDSKTTFSKTDEDVKNFITKWKNKNKNND